MWVYVKHLEVPVSVRRPDPRLAAVIFSQFGGPDGEFSAAWRYISQMWAMPTGMAKALVVDIGTEELDHLEMVGTVCYKLMEGASPRELEAAGLGAHYAQHGYNMFLHDAAGVPWMASYYQSFDDPVTSLHEDMAAEQKARTTYENLLDLTDDDEVRRVLAFLRQREVTHFQRFGEALDRIHEYLQSRHVF
ncbi:MAG: manganese catalase family protein [Clostridia bacterium]|nr:manganese catalase family protein [Clostridia bacterium]